MKRYRVITHDLDSRANVLRHDIHADWEPSIQATWVENQRRVRESFLHEFGVQDGDRKIEDAKAIGALPFSLVAFHNKFLRQARTAFVSGAYYPALTATCALGERILNHLIITLRDDFQSTLGYKRVHRKSSFDNWSLAVEVLSEWDVLPQAVATEFENLSLDRNAALHFRPETDTNERQLALNAITRLQTIVQLLFPGFGGRWYIQEIRGAAYVRLAVQSDPFVRRIILPNCAFVGPRHRLEHTARGWKVVDPEIYENRAITDAEFAQLVDPR